MSQQRRPLGVETANQRVNVDNHMASTAFNYTVKTRLMMGTWPVDMNFVTSSVRPSVELFARLWGWDNSGENYLACQGFAFQGLNACLTYRCLSNKWYNHLPIDTPGMRSPQVGDEWHGSKGVVKSPDVPGHKQLSQRSWRAWLDPHRAAFW